MKVQPTDFKINKLLKTLPKYLKEPSCYYKVKKLLLEIISVPHSHSEMTKWANCTQCMDKVRNLNITRKKLGFQTPDQYYAWVKVMEIIHKDLKHPLKAMYKR